MNDSLQQERVKLSDDILSAPTVSMKTGMAYYALADGIYGMDLDTGAVKQIKVVQDATLRISGCYFDGALLGYKTTDAEGIAATTYISSETGETTASVQNVQTLVTWNEQFFFSRVLDGKTQYLVGFRNGSTDQYNIAPENGGVIGALNNGVLMEYAYSENNKQLRLAYYDVVAGIKMAEVVANNVYSAPICPVGVGQMWFLAGNENGGMSLYCLSASDGLVMDPTIVTSPV